MKKLMNLLLCGFLVFSVTSCDKDDDDDDNNDLAAEIVGTWKATSIEAANCTDSDNNLALQDLTECEQDPALGEICLEVTSVFGSDGSFTSTTTTTIDGMSTGSPDVTTGTYTVNNNLVTICDDDDEEDMCTINNVLLDGSTITFVGIDPEDGCTVTIVAEKQ